MTIADRIEIESDERGFELHVWVDEEPEVRENGLMVLNIQNIDLDAFYDQVKGRIGPYLRERDEARASTPTLEARAIEESYARDDAYALSDPKHPAFHSTHADIWDNREGK